jgi:hypothetical protein
MWYYVLLCVIHCYTLLDMHILTTSTRSKTLANIRLIQDERNTKISPSTLCDIEKVLDMVRNTINANIVMQISFVKQIDTIRGDICRSRFVFRAVEKYLKDLEETGKVE